MRTKTVSLIVLLITLVGLVAVAPAASQEPDQPFTATPLTPTTNVTRSVEKDDAPAADATAMRGLVAEDLEVVPIIVTFDESVDVSDLEAISGAQVVYRYKEVFNGASLILAGDKVDAIASLSGVTGVYLDEVGVLDTGIWPEHLSFSDPDPSGKSYDPPPGGPYGCDFGDTAWNPEDAPFDCNNKLIGAYDFLNTYKQHGGRQRRREGQHLRRTARHHIRHRSARPRDHVQSLWRSRLLLERLSSRC
jgi:hypothetical protein